MTDLLVMVLKGCSPFYLSNILRMELKMRSISRKSSVTISAVPVIPGLYSSSFL